MRLPRRQLQKKIDYCLRNLTIKRVLPQTSVPCSASCRRPTVATSAECRCKIEPPTHDNEANLWRTEAWLTENPTRAHRKMHTHDLLQQC